MKSRREPSKCREWEKLRRDKLNKSFQTLSKLLPNHDPSLTLSKIDILQKAAEYIEELQKKLKDVLTEDGVKKIEGEEIKSLSERIGKLLSRNEQLCILLKDAGIRIPSEYGSIKNFKEPLRWSNKITPEQAKQFAKEEAQKENKKETSKLIKKPKPKNGIKKPMVSPSRRKKDQKKTIKKVPITKKPTVINVQLSNIVPIPKPNLSTANQSCFIITNKPPINITSSLHSRITKMARTVVTNSSSLATPKMASIIKPPTTTVIPKVNATLSSLGPGTLILANGNIVPILPQPTTVLPTPTILTNPTPLLLKPPNNNTTLIVMPTKNKEIVTSTMGTKTSTAITTSCATKTFANIKPKIGITRTTQVNKVPIPALTSRYSDLLLSGAKSATEKGKESETKSVTKKVQKVNKAKRKVAAIGRTTNKKSKINHLQPENVSKPNESKLNREINKTEVNIVSTKPSQDSSVTVNNSDVALVDSSVEVRVPLEPMENSENVSSSLSQIQTKEISTNQGNEPAKTNPETVEKPSVNTEIEVASNKEVVTSKLPEIKNTESKDQTVATSKTQTVDDSNNKQNKNEKIHTTNDYQLLNQVKSDNEKVTSTATKTNPSIVQTETTSEISDKNLELGMNLNHSELSNDIFSSLQVPIGGQNPESTSPTAAFLLAFPLVSSLTGVKVTEVIEEENSDSRHGTPTLLQIGTMDTTKTTQSVPSESLTPNLLNLDNFSFFSGKDMCGNFYSSFDNSTCTGNNVYPINSGQMLDNTNTKATSSCKESTVLNQTKAKACEPLKAQNLQTKLTTSEPHTSQNILTTTKPPVLYTTEGQVSVKPNIVTQNNFVRQNTSVTYSKTVSVSSSYIQYDARHKSNHANTASTCKDVSYSTTNRKNSDTIQPTSQYNTATSTTASVAQCNTFNPFSDFSKPNTVHTYVTFSKPYNDPLYTNSTHYSYAHHNENNFEQMYYPTKSSKTNVSAYNPTTYPDPSYAVDCKKRESSSQRHEPVNYYNQAKPQNKEKFSATHPSKTITKTPSQPKPPINWMTTPDFRSQPSNTEYLVPSFGKDIEYNPNSFYSSNSFVSTTHASYFNATSTMYSTEFQDNRKTFDASLPIISTNSTQRNEYEENQFSWSPTKLPQFLETPHSFVSSTLPTLVGDLALGTNQPPFGEQKVDQGTTRDHLIKTKESSRRSKAHSINYDNQSNFLSVSQLVENKSDPSSTRSNRRNSGNRSVKSNSQKASKHSHKATENKELVEATSQNMGMEKNNIKHNQAPNNVNYNMQNIGENPNWMPDCNKSNRHAHKNPQSNYSAEALIGHQNQDSSLVKQRYRQQQSNYGAPNKALPIPSFLSDNIVPYFPPVEIPQDNNFIQANPNYQGSALSHSFSTSVQNNTYPSSSYISTGATITSSYLQSSGLMPEFAHDYATPISDNIIPHTSVVPDKAIDSKHCNRESIKQPTNNSRTEERPNIPQQINTDCSTNSSNNFMKKTKHKHSNENLPGIVDFGFLSMPGSINSPILPDDFHTHSNFLPPPTPSQLYPCKNPLYAKQSTELNSGSILPLPVSVTRTGTQHFESSTAVSNAGSSLTSFNLSAIFPEINKGPVPLPGLYPSESSRNKNYNFQRNYIGSSVQVSFSNKSTASSSYVNSVATTYAPGN